MDLIGLSMAALAALAPAAPPMASPARAVPPSHANPSFARRSPGGAVATATITVRIISNSAQVGPGFGPPLPDMRPRHANVTAADGRQLPALIYDFE